MLRLFTTHRVRSVLSLDGCWHFEPEAEALKSRAGTVRVPGAWETLPGLENYRGRARYRRTLCCERQGHLRLVFGGVSHTADVFLDGQKLGHHYDAFTPFDVVQPDVAPGAHELEVRVDNTFGEHSCLHIENDYYTYGGITRPVELQWVPDVYIDGMQARPVRTAGRWALHLRLRLRNVSAMARTCRVRVSVAGKTVETDAAPVAPGEAWDGEAVIEALDVEAWSAAQPKLYEVTAQLLDAEGAVTDDMIDRVGFREVAVRGRELLLNGRPIRLRGYNRHEDHPQFGCALGVEAMAHDLAIMRDLGCNFVRTCHYPNDRRFLDLCDELGFYVWEESHARNVDTAHPLFREQIGASTREMVTQHVNHPSILMWGCLNECNSDMPEGVPEYAFVIDLIRSLDDSRPVTYASNRYKNDRCFGMADIVSINKYVGWYARGLDEIRPDLEDFLGWLHSPDSHGGCGKPVILSEFGAGAIYGNRQANRSRWSEEYQGDLLDVALDVYLNHPDVVGAAIWQFCDVRITKGWSWQQRPRTMNNKGTVDEYRRPKLAYGVVKARMLEAAAAFGG